MACSSFTYYQKLGGNDSRPTIHAIRKDEEIRICVRVAGSFERKIADVNGFGQAVALQVGQTQIYCKLGASWKCHSVTLQYTAGKIWGVLVFERNGQLFPVLAPNSNTAATIRTRIQERIICALWSSVDMAIMPWVPLDFIDVNHLVRSYLNTQSVSQCKLR